MLLYEAVLRKERRDRAARAMDAAMAAVGGKPLTDHLKRLKD